MKKWICLLFIGALLLLAACGAKEEGPKTYAREIDGHWATIVFSQEDNSKGTVHVGDDIYHFEHQLDGTMEIRYPDGSTFSMTKNGMGGMSTLDSVAPEEKGYLDNFGLMWAIEDAMNGGKSHKDSIPLPVALLLAGMGGWMIYRPRHFWYVSYGWHYKDAEPSQASLATYTIGGIVLVIVGILGAIA